MASAQAKLDRFKQLKARKEPWLDIYQLLGEYIHIRKQNFTSSSTPGDFLARLIFDSTGPKAAKTSASSLVGMLWPANSKKVQLTRPDDVSDTTENKEYYDFVTEKVRKILDNPKGRLTNAVNEYMLDQVVFGTSGVEAFADEKSIVGYRAWGIKEIHIAEGKAGHVDTIYLELSFTVQRMIREYGEENVSESTRKKFVAGKLDDDINIIIAIEPRLEKNGTQGIDDSEFESTHIEVEQKHILKESGFDEIPIKIGRFVKLTGEELGRSPGMDALPDVLEANAIWEAVTIAIEKNLDPPLGVLDDGRLGAGEIDTSAGAVTVFNISGRAGEGNPVFPINTVGEIKQTVSLLEVLAKNIGDNFFIDRLLDFNNESQMTLGEARLRNQLRHNTLGSILATQISDVFNQVIESTFNLAFEQGELGIIEGSPDHELALLSGENPVIIPTEIAERMISGEDVYQIQYFTPAMRILQAEEAEGIMQTWEFTANVAAIKPQVIDGLDEDISVKRIAELTGAPQIILKSKQVIEETRAVRAKAEAEAAEMEQAKQLAEAARNAGQSGLIPLPGGQASKAA